MLEECHVHDVLTLGDADAIAEGANRFRRVTAAPHADQRGHTRIVPAGDVLLLNELEQPPLAHHGVGQIEPGELDLAGTGGHRQVLDQPVVERPVILELQRAQRVRDVLQRIGRRMREVVHRIDAPGVAGAMVVRPPDPIENGIAQVDVVRGHVDLRPEHVRAVFEFAIAHAAEQIEVLRDRACAVRALATGLGQRAAELANLLRRRAVDVGQIPLDQMDCVLVEMFEVVRREEQSGPLESQPAHVFFDRLDVLDILFRRVRIVEAQVARAPELEGDAEVETNRLGVPDMQIAVRFRRESRDHARDDARLQLVRDHRTDEVLAVCAALERPGDLGGGIRHGIEPLIIPSHRPQA